MASNFKTCAECLYAITEDYYLTCSICNDSYNIGCTETSYVRFSFMEQAQRDAWICASCLKKQNEQKEMDTMRKEEEAVDSKSKDEKEVVDGIEPMDCSPDISPTTSVLGTGPPAQDDTGKLNVVLPSPLVTTKESSDTTSDEQKKSDTTNSSEATYLMLLEHVKVFTECVGSESLTDEYDTTQDAATGVTCPKSPIPGSSHMTTMSNDASATSTTCDDANPTDDASNQQNGKRNAARGKKNKGSRNRKGRPKKYTKNGTNKSAASGSAEAIAENDSIGDDELADTATSSSTNNMEPTTQTTSASLDVDSEHVRPATNVVHDKTDENNIPSTSTSEKKTLTATNGNGDVSTNSSNSASVTLGVSEAVPSSTSTTSTNLGARKKTVVPRKSEPKRNNKSQKKHSKNKVLEDTPAKVNTLDVSLEKNHASDTPCEALSDGAAALPILDKRDPIEEKLAKLHGEASTSSVIPLPLGALDALSEPEKNSVKNEEIPEIKIKSKLIDDLTNEINEPKILTSELKTSEIAYEVSHAPVSSEVELTNKSCVQPPTALLNIDITHLPSADIETENNVVNDSKSSEAEKEVQGVCFEYEEESENNVQTKELQTENLNDEPVLLETASKQVEIPEAPPEFSASDLPKGYLNVKEADVTDLKPLTMTHQTLDDSTALHSEILTKTMEQLEAPPTECNTKNIKFESIPEKLQTEKLNNEPVLLETAPKEVAIPETPLAISASLEVRDTEATDLKTFTTTRQTSDSSNTLHLENLGKLIKQLRGPTTESLFEPVVTEEIQPDGSTLFKLTTINRETKPPSARTDETEVTTMKEGEEPKINFDISVLPSLLKAVPKLIQIQVFDALKMDPEHKGTSPMIHIESQVIVEKNNKSDETKIDKPVTCNKIEAIPVMLKNEEKDISINAEKPTLFTAPFALDVSGTANDSTMKTIDTTKCKVGSTALSTKPKSPSVVKQELTTTNISNEQTSATLNTTIEASLREKNYLESTETKISAVTLPCDILRAPSEEMMANKIDVLNLKGSFGNIKACKRTAAPPTISSALSKLGTSDAWTSTSPDRGESGLTTTENSEAVSSTSDLPCNNATIPDTNFSENAISTADTSPTSNTSDGAHELSSSLCKAPEDANNSSLDSEVSQKKQKRNPWAKKNKAPRKRKNKNKKNKGAKNKIKPNVTTPEEETVTNVSDIVDIIAHEALVALYQDADKAMKLISDSDQLLEPINNYKSSATNNQNISNDSTSVEQGPNTRHLDDIPPIPSTSGTNPSVRKSNRDISPTPGTSGINRRTNLNLSMASALPGPASPKLETTNKENGVKKNKENGAKKNKENCTKNNKENCTKNNKENCVNNKPNKISPDRKSKGSKDNTDNNSNYLNDVSNGNAKTKLNNVMSSNNNDDSTVTKSKLNLETEKVPDNKTVVSDDSSTATINSNTNLSNNNGPETQILNAKESIIIDKPVTISMETCDHSNEKVDTAAKMFDDSLTMIDTTSKHPHGKGVESSEPDDKLPTVPDMDMKTNEGDIENETNSEISIICNEMVTLANSATDNEINVLKEQDSKLSPVCGVTSTNTDPVWDGDNNLSEQIPSKMSPTPTEMASNVIGGAIRKTTKTKAPISRSPSPPYNLNYVGGACKKVPTTNTTSSKNRKSRKNKPSSRSSAVNPPTRDTSFSLDPLNQDTQNANLSDSLNTFKTPCKSAMTCEDTSTQNETFHMAISGVSDNLSSTYTTFDVLPIPSTSGTYRQPNKKKRVTLGDGSERMNRSSAPWAVPPTINDLGAKIYCDMPPFNYAVWTKPPPYTANNEGGANIKTINNLSLIPGISWIIIPLTNKTSSNERGECIKTFYDMAKVSLMVPQQSSGLFLSPNTPGTEMMKQEPLVEHFAFDTASFLPPKRKEETPALKEFRSSVQYLCAVFNALRHKLISVKMQRMTIIRNYRVYNIQLHLLAQLDKSVDIEIFGIPERTGENLLSILEVLFEKISCTIHKSDLVSWQRSAKGKKKRQKRKRPCIISVTLANQKVRQKIMTCLINYNKINERDRLNSSHLGFKGQKFRIYIRIKMDPSKMMTWRDGQFVWVTESDLTSENNEISDRDLDLT